MLQQFYRVVITFASLFVLVALGCTKRIPTEPTVFAQADDEYQLTIMVDLSGSFADKMADEGHAYRFALRVIDEYFRNRIGFNDKLIIAQISATEPLLWEGKPLDLRREFPSASDFRDFLLRNSDPNASFVYDGMHTTLEYIMMDPGVKGGRTKSALLVLSDLIDNGPQPAKRARLLTRSLADYGACGGTVGLYYVDTSRVANWIKALREAGIREFEVESEIVGKPTLPNFE